jgi:glycerol uptake facilitator-like aquaporin
MFVDEKGEYHWARLIAYEIILSCIFIIVYLVLRFDSEMKKVDRVVKGIACSFVLGACLIMTNGEGYGLNPALGFAQCMYMIGLGKERGSTIGIDDAKFIWIYMALPYIGAFLAAFFFRMHKYIEKNEFSQRQPV